MAPFETPHALDNAEIKTLQENKNELSDDMKERLQDTQKRELFVSEYKNYLQRSQNEASKDMVTKLFWNIFDLAEKEWISIDEKEEAAVIEWNNTTDWLAQGEGSTLSEGATDQLIQPWLRDNAEIVIIEPIDINKSYSEMMDYVISEEFSRFIERTSDGQIKIEGEKKDILKIMITSYKSWLEKIDFPIITQENVNDPVIQSQVEKSMDSVLEAFINNTSEIFNTFLEKKIAEWRENSPVVRGVKRSLTEFDKMKISPKESSFSNIIREIQWFQKFKNQMKWLDGRPNNEISWKHIPSTDIIINDNKEKELNPHREVSSEICNMLNLNKKNASYVAYAKDAWWWKAAEYGAIGQVKWAKKKEEVLTIEYGGSQRGWGRNILIITKKTANGTKESVTIKPIFDKATGKVTWAKSLSYLEKDKDGKEKSKRSGENEAYNSVKAFLWTVKDIITEGDIDQQLMEAVS